MQYLTKSEIKKQCNIDAAYEGDDDFIEMIGDSAEDFVSQLIDTDLTEVYAKYGEIPAALRHAMRMMWDYFYSQQRGSSAEAMDIPNAVTTMLKLYRSFN